MGEVATAVLLLVGAGLLLRTLLAVEDVDRGYRAESVLTMLVDPLGSQYPTAESRCSSSTTRSSARSRPCPAWRVSPGRATLPLGSSTPAGVSFEIVGDAPLDDSQRPSTGYQIVSPTYFSTLDLPIVAGRAFDERDTRDGVPVCIVNEAFAQALSAAARRSASASRCGRRRRRKPSRSCARSSAWRAR